MSTRYLTADSRWMLALLAALVALGPLSVDMYLPAMPMKMEALETDISYMSLTLSAYLTGLVVLVADVNLSAIVGKQCFLQVAVLIVLVANVHGLLAKLYHLLHGFVAISIVLKALPFLPRPCHRSSVW